MALTSKFGTERINLAFILNSLALNRSLGLNSNFGAEYMQMQSKTQTASAQSNCNQALTAIGHLCPGMRCSGQLPEHVPLYIRNGLSHASNIGLLFMYLTSHLGRDLFPVLNMQSGAEWKIGAE